MRICHVCGCEVFVKIGLTGEPFCSHCAIKRDYVKEEDRLSMNLCQDCGHILVPVANSLPKSAECKICGKTYEFTPDTVVDALTKHSSYSDPVTKPSHYNWHPSGVECKTIAEAFQYNLGCAIKYIWRSGRKGDVIEDLKKAQEYIKNEIERLGRKP